MVTCTVDAPTNTVTFCYQGRLDAVTTEELSPLVEERVSALAKGDEGTPLRVIFDMKGVDYVASAFIRLCIKVAKAVHGDNFAMTNSSPVIKKTFKIVGLAEQLHLT